ncbi:Small integral membrane 15 [Brachionus plicatilis]|uniref:Small integral membrane protein 15 n=1 Tax=Brachionus plicatilis TaxID=10195 RepID=A0A3M7QJH3_BRAPC|nr:Small integral membrane 15 [Brachionus plicatilis]
MFDINWQENITILIQYAGENPWQFLYYMLLILSPLFGLSAFLSYKLVQEIDKEEKENKKRLLKDTNKLKVQRCKPKKE